MAEIKKKDGIIQISLFWPDLTKKAQDQLREALNIPENEDNNWTYIPMTITEINEEDTNE